MTGVTSAPATAGAVRVLARHVVRHQEGSADECSRGLPASPSSSFGMVEHTDREQLHQRSRNVRGATSLRASVRVSPSGAVPIIERGAPRVGARRRYADGRGLRLGRRAANGAERRRRMNQPTVAVMAKAPAAGRVKTRCCPPCTPTQAAELAAAALADTLETVASCAATRRVVALDGQRGPWLPADFTVVEQCGGDLGARIDHVLAELGPPVVLIGIDTPQVTAPALDDALGLLTSRVTDAVVGPACDGGVLGIGPRRCRPRAVRHGANEHVEDRRSVAGGPASPRRRLARAR